MNEKMARMAEISEVKRGYTTGANEFFYLDKEKIRLWGIEKRFLEPIITSPKNIQIRLTTKEISEWLLAIHETKEELSSLNALKYIEHGENVDVRIRGGKDKGENVKGYQNLSTLKARDIWYSIPKREPAPLLFSCKIWERLVVAVNEAKVQADKAFYEIRPKNRKDINALAGILNSTLTALFAELYGRFYGGGVLELEIYECKDLPVVNPEKLTSKERRKIEDAFSQVCGAQNKGDEKLEQVARTKLDDAIFDVLALKENERQQVYEGLESLRRMRLQRKEVNVLVETAEKWKPHKKPKKERIIPIEPSKRLDKWMDT
jgi:hypothetical protein